MRILHPIIVITLLAITSACKNHKTISEKVAENESVADVNAVPEEDAAPQREPVQPDTFKVVISLISIGEGTDPEGPAKIQRFLDAWKSEKGKSPAYKTQPWGREGELDYNFTLHGMSPNDQKEFVTALQSAMKDEKLILITENKPNRFKR